MHPEPYDQHMPDRTSLPRPPGWAQDLLLAAFVTVMQVQGTVSRVHDDAASVLRPLDTLGHALLITGGAVVVVRRRCPATVFAVSALASLAYYTLDYPDGPGWLGLFVATYTLTALGDGRRSLAVAAGGIAVLATGWLVAAGDIEPRAAIGWVFFRIGASVMSAALGESVRSRRVIAADALAHAERDARARLDAERLRIAREVHDTVAHAIAIINVQSGVTAHVLDKRPDRAREALQTIERTSSRALHEMRAILGVLRDPDDSRVPHPGLDQIDELAAEARRAGLDLAVAAPAAPPPVPGAVGSAVYRILQESITNVIRHAGPTRVVVALDYGPDNVRVSVTNENPDAGTKGRQAAAEGRAVGGRAAADGRTPVMSAPSDGRAAADGRAASQGRGITGMRERCRLLGGDLDAGPVPGGGFAVTAHLPLAPRP